MASIRELHQQLVKKERSAVEITQEALDRIQKLEPKLHSFLHVTSEAALAQAQQVDAKIAAGEEIGLLTEFRSLLRTICVRKAFQPPVPRGFCNILCRPTNRP